MNRFVKCHYGRGWITETLMLAKYGSFKVIGEISSEAIWVKERDEFDENQLGIKYKDYSEVNIYPFVENMAFDKYIVIKGPCGHFH